MDALDDVTFTVIKRELSDEERKNYKKTKEHLFDLVKEGGQKRLIFFEEHSYISMLLC